MKYVMGLDGGGSQTTAVIVNEAGTLVGEGHAGGANHQKTGIDATLNSISEATGQALAAAEIDAEEVNFVQYCLAGADREADFRILQPALSTLPFGSWNLVSDAWQGLRAGTEDNVGVVLVCGSGTNAIGRSRSGHTVQVGGFGYLLGDAAGGTYLAMKAFRVALRSWEGREAPTSLTERVPAALGFPCMQDLYEYLLDHGARHPRALDLSLVVHQAADDGDVIAQRLLQGMGRELASAANAVITRLDGFANETTIPVVVFGGMIQQGRSAWALDVLNAAIHERFPAAAVTILDVMPVYGSVLLAFDQSGLTIPPGLKGHFLQQRK